MNRFSRSKDASRVDRYSKQSKSIVSQEAVANPENAVSVSPLWRFFARGMRRTIQIQAWRAKANRGQALHSMTVSRRLHLYTSPPPPRCQSQMHELVFWSTSRPQKVSTVTVGRSCGMQVIFYPGIEVSQTQRSRMYYPSTSVSLAQLLA